MSARSGDGVRERLRVALRDAMKTRDMAAVAPLRSALAALDDAEAVDASAAGLVAVDHAHIAGTVGGVGAGEVARATLDEQQQRAVVAREADERREAAALYEQHGRADEAARVRAEAAVLDRVLADAGADTGA